MDARDGEGGRAEPPALPAPVELLPVGSGEPPPVGQRPVGFGARGHLPPTGGAAASVPQGARRVSPGAAAGLAAFAGALDHDGALWVGPLAGNGGRDVVLFVPPRLEPHGRFELVVHFHGTYSENIEPRRPGVPKKRWVGWDRLRQTLDAITDLQERRTGSNVVLVYPISAGKRMEPSHRGRSNKMYDRMWMRAVRGDARYVDDFDALLDQVGTVLATEFGVPRARVDPMVMAEGHSAGGIALRNVAAAGTHRVREYLFLDASFQDWADGCWAEVRAHGVAARISIVLTHGGIADPFGKRDPWCTRLEDAARGWPALAAGCEATPNRPTGLHAFTCSSHADAAAQWPKYAAWCEAMKTDMAAEARVFVLRTRVAHGEQPRHFAGGLGLPADRWGR